MSSQRFRLIMLTLVVSCSGCGTINNLAPPTQPAHGGPLGPINDIYGGFRTSTSEGWRSLVHPTETASIASGVALLAIDAPLSLVADTLTLPITIPAHFKRSEPAEGAGVEPARE